MSELLKAVLFFLTVPKWTPPLQGATSSTLGLKLYSLLQFFSLQPWFSLSTVMWHGRYWWEPLWPQTSSISTLLWLKSSSLYPTSFLLVMYEQTVSPVIKSSCSHVAFSSQPVLSFSVASVWTAMLGLSTLCYISGVKPWGTGWLVAVLAGWLPWFPASTLSVPILIYFICITFSSRMYSSSSQCFSVAYQSSGLWNTLGQEKTPQKRRAMQWRGRPLKSFC